MNGVEIHPSDKRRALIGRADTGGFPQFRAAGRGSGSPCRPGAGRGLKTGSPGRGRPSAADVIPARGGPGTRCRRRLWAPGRITAAPDRAAEVRRSRTMLIPVKAPSVLRIQQLLRAIPTASSAPASAAKKKNKHRKGEGHKIKKAVSFRLSRNPKLPWLDFIHF